MLNTIVMFVAMYYLENHLDSQWLVLWLVVVLLWLMIGILYTSSVVLHPYTIPGRFGEFGKSSVTHQTKTIQINTYL